MCVTATSRLTTKSPCSPAAEVGRPARRVVDPVLQPIQQVRFVCHRCAISGIREGLRARTCPAPAALRRTPTHDAVSRPTPRVTLCRALLLAGTLPPQAEAIRCQASVGGNDCRLRRSIQDAFNPIAAFEDISWSFVRHSVAISACCPGPRQMDSRTEVEECHANVAREMPVIALKASIRSSARKPSVRSVPECFPWRTPARGRWR